MKRFSLLLLGVLAASFVIVQCGGGLTTPSGKTLVSINGKKITEGDVEFLGDINPRIKAQLSTPAGKKRILDNLVDQELLYQEAVKKGINRDPEVRAKSELYRRVIVAQSLMDKELQDAAKKYYEKHPEEFQKLRMSQILIKYETPEKGKKKRKKGKRVRSEKEALKLATEIKGKLDKGEDFSKLAKEYSDDMATKNRGGDMGLVARDDQRFKARGYEPLIDKAFEMKVGEVAGPIKTEKGYHIIIVTRGAEQEPFADAERGILFKIRTETRSDLLSRLKKEGNVTYAEDLQPREAPAVAKPAGAGKPSIGEIKAPAGKEAPKPKQETKKEVKKETKKK